MKLILAILRDEDAENISHALVAAEYRVTRIASTGGLWRRGSTTLMIGTDAERVQGAIELMRQHCSTPPDAGQKRGTLFVLNVAHYEQL